MTVETSTPTQAVEELYKYLGNMTFYLKDSNLIITDWISLAV